MHPLVALAAVAALAGPPAASAGRPPPRPCFASAPPPRRYRLFRQPTEPVATLALLDDAENGRPRAIERMGYLLPASYHRVWTPLALAELGMAALFLLAAVVTLGFALIWVPRWLFRRLRGVPRLRLRGWPLLSALLVVTCVGVAILSAEDAVVRLGTPSPWAITLFLTTIAFPLTAVAGLVSAIRTPPGEVRRAIRILALATSLVFVVVSVYLAWFGVIGWRSWT